MLKISFCIVFVIPLVVLAQNDVNLKNLLEKKSTIVAKRAWGNWNCKNRQNGDQDLFDLFCQTDNDFDIDEDDSGDNGKILPDELNCIDDKVKYRAPKKKKLDKIQKVQSADACRIKCSETRNCLYWTWIQKRQKNSCSLYSRVKNTGFRRQNIKAVSGTMLNGCNPKQQSSQTQIRTRAGQSCIDPRGIQGTCNYLFESQCSNVLRAIRILGMTPEVGRFLQQAIRSPCGFEQFDYTLCCVPTNGATTTTTPSPPTISQDPKKSCGRGESRRIVGGEDAALNAWPWATALGVPSNGDRIDLRCGGTLINKNYVLTAAHCFFAGADNPTMVRLGDLDITTDSDGATHEDIPIQRSIIHPSYDRDTQKNDIALVRLQRSVTFRRGLIPACLPDRFRGFPLASLNERPQVIGWGKTDNNKPVSPRLQQVSVPLVNNPTCKDKYGAAIAGVDIGTTQLCAGEDGKDSCAGDSGGPMLSSELNNGRWAVIGIVSFGARGLCANSLFPGVYTRVDKYLDWIENNSK